MTDTPNFFVGEAPVQGFQDFAISDLIVAWTLNRGRGKSSRGNSLGNGSFDFPSCDVNRSFDQSKADSRASGLLVFRQV